VLTQNQVILDGISSIPIVIIFFWVINKFQSRGYRAKLALKASVDSNKNSQVEKAAAPVAS
jgi:hypothetical protein